MYSLLRFVNEYGREYVVICSEDTIPSEHKIHGFTLKDCVDLPLGNTGFSMMKRFPTDVPLEQMDTES